MMDSFTRQELDRLAASQGGPHLSIYLPAPNSPNEAEQDATRLANLLRANRETLVEYWMPRSDADALLSPVQDFCRSADLLSDRRHGVAIFRSSDTFNTYALEQTVDERAVIGRTFHVRPILPQVERTAFSILTLSRNQVALLSATKSAVAEVGVPGLPKSFAAELADVTVDRGAQVHSSGQGTFGKQSGVYHGQGGHPDTVKSELREYLRKVDDVVAAYLQQRDSDLILAGVDDLTSMYRDISNFPRLCKSTISGNVDHMNSVDLLDRALSVMAEEWDRRREASAKRIRDPREKPVATDPEQILCAAHEGRIDTLFFDRDAELFGSFFPDTRTMKEIQHQPTGDPLDPSHDLIEMAVVQTLLRRGSVHPVEQNTMPVDAKMAASLRY